MNRFRNSKFAKAISVATGLITGFVMMGGAMVSTASAQSASDLQALIDSLLAQIQTLQAQLSTSTGGAVAGGGATCTYTFSTNMSQGDTGALNLQKVLNMNPATQVASSGVGSPGQETDYFGRLTKGAVIAFQDFYAADVLAPVGLTSGTGYVGPSTRAKLNSICSTPTTPPVVDGGQVLVPGGTGTTPVVSGSDELTVTPSASNAQFIAIPFNVSAMSFGTFDFTAGSADVTVNGVTVNRSGLGDKDDFDEVWVVSNGVQHGPEKSIITGDVAMINFGNNPMMIPAGQTMSVQIMGALQGEQVNGIPISAGHYNSLGFGAVDTATPVNGLPVFGPQTAISTQSATVVTLTRQGSDKTVSVGNMQTEIGRFQLGIDSTNDQDILVNSIIFDNQGSVSSLSDVLANVNVTQGGVTVSQGFSFVGSDKLMLDMGDFLMEDGQTQSFTVLADIISAEVGDTIILQLDDHQDLVATEVGTGAGVRVDGFDTVASSPASNVDLRTYMVETGDINLTINNASSRNVAPGLDDILLIDGIMVVDSEFEVDGLKVRLGAGTSIAANTPAGLQANFENFSLIIDGNVIDTVDTLTDTNGAGGAADGNVNDDTGSMGDYFDFNSSFSVGPGTHTIQVEADVQTGAVNADSIELIIFSGDFDNPEYTFSGDQVPMGELTGQADGAVITVLDASLIATRNDGNSSETLIGGSKMVQFFKFTLDANDASDVFVSSMTFAQNTAAAVDYAASDVTNMRIFVGGAQVGSPVDLTSGNLSDVNFTVPASQQVQVVLEIDTNTSSGTSTLQIDLVDMDATDEEGNTVVVAPSAGGTLAVGNAEASDLMNVGTGGLFTAEQSGNTPDEDILIADGGSVWYPISIWDMTAEDEDLILTDLFPHQLNKQH